MRGVAHVRLADGYRTQRAHLGHPPGVADLDAQFLLESRDHGLRCGGPADDDAFQARNARVGFLEVAEQPEKDTGNAGCQCHILVRQEQGPAPPIETESCTNQLDTGN